MRHVARSLIPRRILFDNSTFFGAKLSPDGRWISWLAPVDGVLNVWLAPADDIKAGQPVTRTKGRPINWQDWTADGRFLMFLNDETGDENHHLFVVDPVARSLRDLTPIANVNVQLSRWSPDAPGEVAVKINDRDARWHDLYRIDLATGQRTLIWENTQELAHVGLDWQLRPRHARSNAPDGGAKLWRIEGTALLPWRDVPYEDLMTTWAGIFNRSNERVLFYTSLGRETAAFHWHDWTTGQETLIAQHPKADCSRVARRPPRHGRMGNTRGHCASRQGRHFWSVVRRPGLVHRRHVHAGRLLLQRPGRRHHQPPDASRVDAALLGGLRRVHVSQLRRSAHAGRSRAAGRALSHQQGRPHQEADADLPRRQRCALQDRRERHHRRRHAGEGYSRFLCRLPGRRARVPEAPQPDIVHCHDGGVLRPPSRRGERTCRARLRRLEPRDPCRRGDASRIHGRVVGTLEENHGVVPKTTRRSVLPILLGLGSSQDVFAQPRGPFFAGLQLFTVRNQLAADLDGTLRRVAETGYLEVETAGFGGTTAAIIRSRLRQHALSAPSMHAGFDDLQRNLDAVVKDAVALGSRFIVCPSIDADQRRTADDWKRVCQTLNRIGRAVRGHGMTLAYHNHDFEFAPFDDRTTPFQLMMRETDPEDVKLELDVYWLAKAGLNPAQSLTNARYRVVMVHLKDMAADGSTVELGAGTLDFGPIIRAALAVGAKRMFVEQDDSPNPLQSIATSLKYLQRLPLDVRPRWRA